MIKGFRDKNAEEIYNNEKPKKVSVEVARVTLRKLRQLEAATDLLDMRVPPSNRLELLKGNLKGFYSIRVNKQWRIIFKWDGTDAREVGLIDYH